MVYVSTRHGAPPSSFAEAVLAVKYREKDRFGTMSGGPMYYLSRGLGSPRLGLLFAFFASIAAFGIGNMVQSNSVADSVEASIRREFPGTEVIVHQDPVGTVDHDQVVVEPPP